MKLPPRPCEMTTSGSLSPVIGQSFVPGKVIPPRSISPGSSEQGYHIAPLRTGPSASAGTWMNRKPAACASVAARQRVIVPRSLAACIGGSLVTRFVTYGGLNSYRRRGFLTHSYHQIECHENVPALPKNGHH